MGVKKRRVFISYASKSDYPKLAEEIKSHLKFHNTRISDIFVDTSSIDGGAEWEKKVNDECTRCDIFVALIDDKYTESKYCRDEFDTICKRWKNKENILIFILVLKLYNTKNFFCAGKFQHLLGGKTVEELKAKNPSKDIALEISNEISESIKKYKKTPSPPKVPKSKAQNSKIYIGIDVGTTKIAGGIVRFDDKGDATYEQEKFIRISLFPTKDNNGGKLKENTTVSKSANLRQDYIINEVIPKLIQELLNSEGLSINNIAGIGLGLPGQVDVKEGILSYAPGLGIEKINFVSLLSESLKKYYPSSNNINICIDNDVNCATLAALHLGLGKDLNNFVCIYFGTGIGAGIVFNKQLIRGNTFAAGEVGHMKIYFNDEARQCNCGKFGCYEEYASARALVREVRLIFLNYLDSRLLAEELKCQGDEARVQLIDNKDTIIDVTPEEIAAYLSSKKASDGLMQYICEKAINKIACNMAIGVANIATCLNPEKIILGGGLIEGFYRQPQFKSKFKEKFEGLLFDFIDSSKRIKSTL